MRWRRIQLHLISLCSSILCGVVCLSCHVPCFSCHVAAAPPCRCIKVPSSRQQWIAIALGWTYALIYGLNGPYIITCMQSMALMNGFNNSTRTLEEQQTSAGWMNNESHGSMLLSVCWRRSESDICARQPEPSKLHIHWSGSHK